MTDPVRPWIPPDIIRTPDGTHRYRYDGHNVTLRFDLTVEDRRFTARETVDAAMWEYRFNANRDEFESYIRSWIRMNFGLLSDGAEAYQWFRDRLFVVLPEDAHDRPTCRRTSETDDAPWPRCVNGALLTEPPMRDPEPPERPVFGGMFGPSVRIDTVKGACTCRCHPVWVVDNVVHGLRTTTVDD